MKNSSTLPRFSEGQLLIFSVAAAVVLPKRKVNEIVVMNFLSFIQR